jgi:hypothetical protein
MSVKIRTITDHEWYEVNGNTIAKNNQGNWIFEERLSWKEFLAFVQYENIVIKNPRFKKHTKATYKG